MIPTGPKLEPASKPPAAPRRSMLFYAVFWGGFMFVFNSLIPTLRQAFATGHVEWFPLILGAVIWSLGGLAFGWILTKWMRWIAGRKSANPAKSELEA